MRHIAKIIYLFFIWLDKATGCYERYSYETAPYCGHAHDGHNGAFTRSHFHESDGGGETHGWVDRWILGVRYSNVDGNEYWFHIPLRNWVRWFYWEVRKSLKYSCMKIDYPYGKRTLYVNLVHFQPRRGYSKRVSTLHIFRLYRGVIPCSHSTIVL
jgi:hypothetical protein